MTSIEQSTAGSEATRPAIAPRRRSRARRLAISAAAAVGTILAGYYVLCVLLLLVYRFVNPPITGVQLERLIEARVSRHEYHEQRRFVSMTRIPDDVKHAVIAGEDGNFLTHWGYDFGEMKKASGSVLEGEMPRGASTITQQLVKNLFGCTCRNPVRKLYDLALAAPAELFLGKRRILELYLNNVEWGPGIFGVAAASQYHYHVPVADLSRSQGAGLAALLPNPLERTPESTADYRREILHRMDARGW